MGRRETQLVNVLEDVCKAVEHERGSAVDDACRDFLSAYMLRSYESGVTDTLQLKEEVLKKARSLWRASSN